YGQPGSRVRQAQAVFHLYQLNVQRFDGIERQLFGEVIGVRRDVGPIWIVDLNVFFRGERPDGVEGSIVNGAGVAAVHGAADVAEQVPGVLRLQDGVSRKQQEQG